MPRDKTKVSKTEQAKRSKKQDELNKKKKKNITSDSDNDFIASDSEEDEMNVHEFRKYVQKIFPSKNLDKKIKAGEKVKKIIEKTVKKNKKVQSSSSSENDSDELWETETYESSEESIEKKSRKRQKKTKNISSDEDDEEDELWETATDDSEEKSVEKKRKSHKKSKNVSSDEDDDEDDEDDVHVKGSKKLNIIFTIGGVDEDEYDSEDDDDSDYEGSDEDYDETEDEDESVSTDETEDSDDDYESVSETSESEHEKNTKNKKVKKQVDKPNSEMLEKLKLLLSQNPKDKSIQKCIEVYEEDINKIEAKKQKKQKKQKDKNLRIFKKIVRDKNTMNDFAFYEKLEIENQKKIIKELREINKITRIEKPYRMTLLESTIPVQFKAAAMKKINSLRYMEPGSGEFYKIKNWVDTFMRIPFGKYDGLPISFEDGVDKCHEFMENAQKTLNDAVYGLNDAKMQIMQMMGQLLTNPNAIGTAIAIHGPPGTGKTSLVKEGISKILNRPFAFIALGGATDSSFLEGHSYTYEGSTWGKIVQILIDSKCMNPVIYFDELDKISDTPRGEEIAGILTHLTDTTQNSQFHDKYFAEINFDLSKCLFIFSYNDETKVNPILKDRMYRIKTKGYSSKEKTIISNNYLLPKIREQVKFNEGDIIIPDATISHIIDTHCNKEDGVRNMKRCLEIIYTKLNLYRLMKPNSNLFEGELSLKVEFPFTVTKDIVDKLIKREKDLFSSALYTMYV